MRAAAALDYEMAPKVQMDKIRTSSLVDPNIFPNIPLALYFIVYSCKRGCRLAIGLTLKPSSEAFDFLLLNVPAPSAMVAIWLPPIMLPYLSLLSVVDLFLGADGDGCSFL